MIDASFGRGVLGKSGSTDVIAATGSGHNCMLERALALVHAAADGGARAILFQTYSTDLYPDSAPVLQPLVGRGLISGKPGSYAEYMRSRVMGGDWLRLHPNWEEQWAQQHSTWNDVLAEPRVQELLRSVPMAEQKQLYAQRRRQWFKEISDVCLERGVEFGAAVFGEDLAELSTLVASGEIELGLLSTESMDHHRTKILVPEVARQAKELNIPYVMSLGTRIADSREKAISIAQQAECELLPLHSVSAEFGGPAATPEELELREIARLRDTHGVPVGFADYSVGHQRDTGEYIDPAQTAAYARHAGASIYKVQIRLPQEKDQSPMGAHRAVSPTKLQEITATLAEIDQPNRDQVPEQYAVAAYQNVPDNPGLRPCERGYLGLYPTVISTEQIRAGEPIILIGDRTNAREGRGGVGIPVEDFVPGTALADIEPGMPIKATDFSPLPHEQTRGPAALQAGKPDGQPRPGDGDLPRSGTVRR